MSQPAAPFVRLRAPVVADAAGLARSRAGGAESAELTDILLQLMVAVPERLEGRPLPRVVAITASRESIGLLLSEPRDDPAAGFEVIDGGLTWTVEPSMISGVAGGDSGCGVPWPMLASFGVVGPDGPAVMANLEELGVVELSGAPGDVLAFAESLAAELAADRFDACPRIVCVDCAWELDALDAVRVVGSSSQVLAEAGLQRRRVGAIEARPAPLPELRRQGLRGIPRPLVIIDPHGHDPHTRASLAGLAGLGLAVVTANRRHDSCSKSPPGRGWRLHVTGRRLRWEPFGVDLRLADIAVPRISPGLRSVPPAGEPSEAGLRAAIAGTDPGEVELQVLGVVQAVGVASPFTSQRALDLSCYLAFHRDGATADKLRYWLWRRDEPPPSAKTFANVVSRARVCLGQDAGGEPYLSYLGADGVYRLSPDVTTDLERFAAWRRLAERVPAAQALEFLRAALWLVRGAPFGGGSGDTFSWADASWRSHVEYLVDCTAHRLADVALESGRLEVARWATLRGLAITPDCEQCCQRRIATARSSGHRREVERVMRHMDRLQREPLPELTELAPSALDAVPSPTA